MEITVSVALTLSLGLIIIFSFTSDYWNTFFHSIPFSFRWCFCLVHILAISCDFPSLFFCSLFPFVSGVGNPPPSHFPFPTSLYIPNLPYLATSIPSTFLFLFLFLFFFLVTHFHCKYLFSRGVSLSLSLSILARTTWLLVEYIIIIIIIISHIHVFI